MLWKQKDQDTRLFEKRTETCAETNTKVDTSIFKERTPDLAQIGTLGKIGGGRIQIFCYEKKKQIRRGAYNFLVRMGQI